MKKGARHPLSQSGLPSGDPAGKGVSLSPDIPGNSTFSKPSLEEPREPSTGDSSIYRVDNADDLLKDQTTPDGIDHSKANPTFRRPGPHYGPNKTKYPYRDGIPNRHNAGLVSSVVELWNLRDAHEMCIPGWSSRVAAKISDILLGLNPKVKERAGKCTVTVKRADIPNLRWIFSVDAGNGPKLVRMRAVRKKNVTSVGKMDVSFSCSCKAWQWLGSEYHAKGEGYMEGKPFGTASTPDIKDPERVNRVCKHVAAVISQVQKWKIPAK